MATGPSRSDRPHVGDGALRGLFRLNGEAPRRAFRVHFGRCPTLASASQWVDSRSWVSHPKRRRSAISARPCDLIEAAFLEMCGPDFQRGPAPHPSPKNFAETFRAQKWRRGCRDIGRDSSFPNNTDFTGSSALTAISMRRSASRSQPLKAGSGKNESTRATEGPMGRHRLCRTRPGRGAADRIEGPKALGLVEPNKNPRQKQLERMQNRSNSVLRRDPLSL